MKINTQIGTQIYKLRKKNKLTQAELASKIKISPTLISHIERGKVNPSIKTLDKIATVLGCSVNINLCSESEESPPCEDSSSDTPAR